VSGTVGYFTIQMRPWLYRSSTCWTWWTCSRQHILWWSTW